MITGAFIRKIMREKIKIWGSSGDPRFAKLHIPLDSILSNLIAMKINGITYSDCSLEALTALTCLDINCTYDFIADEPQNTRDVLEKYSLFLMEFKPVNNLKLLNGKDIQGIFTSDNQNDTGTIAKAFANENS